MGFGLRVVPGALPQALLRNPFGVDLGPAPVRLPAWSDRILLVVVLVLVLETAGKPRTRTKDEDDYDRRDLFGVVAWRSRPQRGHATQAGATPRYRASHTHPRPQRGRANPLPHPIPLSIPHVFFVEGDAMTTEEFAIFLLEPASAMMFPLVEDIRAHGFNL